MKAGIKMLVAFLAVSAAALGTALCLCSSSLDERFSELFPDQYKIEYWQSLYDRNEHGQTYGGPEMAFVSAIAPENEIEEYWAFPDLVFTRGFPGESGYLEKERIFLALTIAERDGDSYTPRPVRLLSRNGASFEAVTLL